MHNPRQLDVLSHSSHQEDSSSPKTADGQPFGTGPMYHAVPFCLMNTKAMNRVLRVPCLSHAKPNLAMEVAFISSSGSAPAP